MKPDAMKSAPQPHALEARELKALELEGLGKTYRDGTVALRGIDLEVKEGEFFGLLGPNGAGKSTTIGIVTSLVRKSAGSVRNLACGEVI